MRRDGTTLAYVDGDWMLAAADPDTGWFVDGSFVDPGQPPAAAPLPPGRILAVHRDGTRTQTDTLAPVYGISISGAGWTIPRVAPPPLPSARSERRVGALAHSTPDVVTAQLVGPPRTCSWRSSRGGVAAPGASWREQVWRGRTRCGVAAPDAA